MYREIPPLKSLHAFEASARHGSFLKAAEELHVSPGAVSRHVKILEDYLGNQLFDRRSNGVALTKIGKSYATKVSKTFSELSIATTSTRNRSKNHVLTLSTLPIFSERWLNPRLKSFNETYNNIDLRVEFHNDVHTPDNPGVDAWILYSDGQHQDCSVTRLFGEEFVPVCNQEILSRLPVRPTPQQIIDYALLHDTFWVEDWAMWAEHYGVTGMNLSTGPKFALYTGVLQSAVDGRGIAMGHSAMIQDYLDSGKLKTIDKFCCPSPNSYHLVVNGKDRDTEIVQSFRSWILKECER